jgi:hypothetical protein
LTDMPRYLSMVRIDESANRGRTPSPALLERMGRLMQEMTKAGTLVETAGLTPTSAGARVEWRHGKTTVVDGPFAESREVIGGYAIVRARDRDEAIAWTKRFLEVHEDEYELACEVREIAER